MSLSLDLVLANMAKKTLKTISYMKQITEQIYNLRREMYQADKLLPNRASEILVQLSALLGNVLEDEVKKEMVYNEKFSELKSEKDSVARAEVEAKATQEYADYRMAKYLKSVVESMISTLKYFLREKEKEFRESGNQ